MELKSKIILLNTICKKRLSEVLQKWHYHSAQAQILKKYQKLKAYTSKILKTRKIPSIRILTANTQNSKFKHLETSNLSFSILNKTNNYESVSQTRPPKMPLNLKKTAENKSPVQSLHPVEEIAIVSSSMLSSKDSYKMR